MRAGAMGEKGSAAIATLERIGKNLDVRSSSGI
jgi:hypothetical protein